MADRKQTARAQKVDHGGDFIQLPRQMLRSPAFLSLSHRARSALYVLLERFNGFNNGRIGLSIDNLGAALGNQNHAANSRALAELMERGFIECMAAANHVKSKAREYRLTFAESGHGGKDKPTNEWRLWKLPQKSGPEATATRTWKPVEATATQRNIPVEATATRATETCGFGGRFRVEATAAHIVSHYEPSPAPSLDVGNSLKSLPELRAALNSLVAAGHVTATSIALAVNMPAGTMSKFRNGRGLPDAYRAPLHMELGRRDAFAIVPPKLVGLGSGVVTVGDALCWREGPALHMLPGVPPTSWPSQIAA
jgi:hypothetical protein